MTVVIVCYLLVEFNCFLWSEFDEMDGGDDITSVNQGASHLLSVSGVALDHHLSGLKGGIGHLSGGEMLVVDLDRKVG